MTTVNVTDQIQRAKFNKFHLNLTILCFVLIMFDGYDVAVFGTLAPPLMAEWELDTVAVGAMGSAGLMGMLFGAVTFGALADLMGRKRIIFTTVLIYSVFTALCGFAQEPTLFTVFRFIAGLGLGGVMPNVIALLADFSPKKSAGTITAIVLSGFAVGGLLAPLLGIFVIPNFGWRYSLWIAAVPLLMLPWILKGTPESMSVLARHNRWEELIRNLKKINPNVIAAPDSCFETPRPSPSKMPLANLFRDQRGPSTVLFWIAFFAHMLLAYGVMQWLPKLMMDSGFDLASSLSFSVIWQLGGIVGTLAAGRIADSFGAKRIIIALYLLGSFVMLGLGLSTNAIILYILVAVAGGAVTGVMNLVQVYIAHYYPPFARATALGSSSSVGRLGGVLGPVLGGVLMSFAFPNQTIFFLFALPGIVAVFAIIFVRDHLSHRRELERAEAEEQLPVS